jgi:polyhydroxybutyrate depolymerase
MPAGPSSPDRRRCLARAGRLHPALVVLLVLGAACRSGSGCSGSTEVAKQPSVVSGRFGGNRPARVIAPQGAAQGVLLALHGYGDTGANFIAALGLPALARRDGLVLVVPDGTPDPRGNRFWDATDACCNFFGRPIDDVAYLRGLLRDVAAAYHVDARRRYVIGLSNGAFMASRLACEAADDIAAIVAIAGTIWADPGRCRPSSPVSVLQVHGDADHIIHYSGGGQPLGLGKGDYPGAVTTVLRWARLDGCAGTRAPLPPALDLDRAPGAETLVEQVSGCPTGVDVRMLTLHGGPHVPAFTSAFTDEVSAWIAAHPKVGSPGPDQGPP